MIQPPDEISLAQDWSAASASRGLARATGGGAALDAAHALAKRLPPSVSGHGGDAALFSAAAEIATLLGEDAQAIATVLADTFNPRCAPPWPLAKIEREATRAAERQATPEGRLARRRAERADASTSPFHPAGADDGTLTLDVTRQGTPRPTISNVGAVLEHVFGERIRHEQCADRIIVKDVDESLGYFPDGEWSDVHTTSTVALCERMRLYVQPSAVDRAVELHGRRYGYNLLADGLRAMAAQWDGTPRVDRALSVYWGAVDTAATRTVARVMFLSLAARGLMPGQKVDTCPVFVGKQGVRKSSSLRALVGAEFFADSPLAIGEKDGAQAIAGKWLWEFAENSSLSRRERDQVKAFLGQQVDRFRASYGRHMRDVPRTCVFAASTNEDEFLNDPTGARRFLPVTVATEGPIRIDAIVADRVQLLGEAAWRWCHGEPNDRGERSFGGGEPHWLSDAEEAALKDVRDAATERDEWESAIADWIDKQRGESFTIADLCDEHTGAVLIGLAALGKREQARVAGILRGLGCERVVDGKSRARRWRAQRS